MIVAHRPKTEIARVLNVRYATLNNALKEFGIIYEGNPHRKGIKRPTERVNVGKYLNNNTIVRASTLRKKLIESGLKEERCECCGNTEWMGRKIPLELHHINMNHYDNRLENLQILCSNCHSLAHNYSNGEGKTPSKVDKKYLREHIGNSKIKSFCPICGKETKTSRQKFCSCECAKKASEKFTPSKKELIGKIKELKSYVQVGKFYGVTDNAIKKRCKREGIYEEIKKYIIHRNKK